MTRFDERARRAPLAAAAWRGGRTTARRALQAAALGCGILLSFGCGGERLPALEGSLTELFALEYDTVELTRSPNGLELAVSFLDRRAGGRNTVLKVVALTGASGVGAPIEFGEEAEGRVRGILSRSVSGDPRTDFPPVQRGTLRLDGDVSQGATLQGDVRVTLEPGTHPASGRTVFGSFEGKVP